MMQLAILYKRTSTGAIQVWYQEVDKEMYRTVSGQLDGKKVISGWTVAEPKNIGKSNETTGSIQALNEVEANYADKLKRGYSYDILDIDQEKSYFSPMLAAQYDKKFKVGVGYFSQPKLDGLRAIVTRDRIQSRSGKDDYITCPHILESLQELFEQFPNLILDGELYNHELRDDFNTIVSLCKQKKPTQADFDATRDVVQYHVYDCFDKSQPNASFGVRNAFVTSHLWIQYDCVRVLDTQYVNTQDQIDEMYGEYLRAGYEGQILRLDAPYENKRSNYLLKRKEFVDDEFVIVSVDEGKGTRSGMAGFITCRLKDGRTFGAGIKGTHEYATQLLVDADKYVGGDVTIRYQALTPDGIPRFPVAVAMYTGRRDT
jgi:DNA ligase-1